jgi:hypothetical protein
MERTGINEIAMELYFDRQGLLALALYSEVIDPGILSASSSSLS